MQTPFVLISGGLGNQMFQYAFLLALRAKGIRAGMDLMPYRWKQEHNGYELERVFGINEKCAPYSLWHKYYYIFLKKYCKKKVLSDYLSFYPQAFEKGIVFYDGFWQFYSYFKDCEEDVRKAFVFQGIDAENLELAKEMQSVNSVSIHFRRGDYLNIPRLQVCDDAYYKNAMNHVKKQVGSPIFYVFSNDVAWADEFMSQQSVDYKIVAGNQGADSYKDMFLMSRCRHNIIANSSFSWWGAWLNENSEKIVIAPSEWNRRVPDFHPQLESWIKI